MHSTLIHGIIDKFPRTLGKSFIQIPHCRLGGWKEALNNIKKTIYINKWIDKYKAYQNAIAI